MQHEQTETQKLHYTIQIFEEDTVLTDHCSSAPRTFLVQPEQLGKLFQFEVSFKMEPGLIRLKSDGNHETVLLTLPRKERKIVVIEGAKRKQKQYAITLPNLLVKMGLDRKADKVTSLQVNAYSGSLKPGTILYEVPLPNIDTTGDVCLGSANVEIGPSYRETAERALFDSPFNNHHNLVGLKHESFQEFYRRNKGKVPLRGLHKVGVYAE